MLKATTVAQLEQIKTDAQHYLNDAGATLDAHQRGNLQSAMRYVSLALEELAPARGEGEPGEPTAAQRAACRLGGCTRSRCAEGGDPCYWSPAYKA